MTRRLGCAAILACAFGCGTKSSTPETTLQADGATGSTSGATADATESTGECYREGAWTCEADSDCICMTETYEHLTMPRPVPSVFNANACIEVSPCTGDPPTVTCRCFNDLIGRGGELLDTHADGCLWTRGPGVCLFAVDEFAGCDLDVPTSCDDTCATIHAREVEEAAHIYTVERRGVRCNGDACEGILEIDDLCYVTQALTQPHDCALSDAEIFATHDANGTPGACSSSTGG